MEKSLSLFFAGLLSKLALAGLVKRNKQLYGLMNIDENHSLIRLPVIALLSYAGTMGSLSTARKILTCVGAIYLAIGGAGLIDKRVGGVLPSGLTKFDLPYHLVTGAFLVWMGMRPGRMMKSPKV